VLLHAGRPIVLCRPRWRALRRLVSGIVVGVLLSLHAAVAPIAAAQDTEWMRPVPGGVVASFREPPGRYAAGHRGVDFAAAAGTSVKAANDGRVSFAGMVAGSLHVVVAHEGGIRTSYAYLATASVSTGQAVRKGQVVGTAGGSGEGHGPGVLHFGVRVGDRYVDPMLLFSPPDLTKMVNLVPADERAVASRATAADERKALEDDDDDGGCGLFQVACDIGEGLVDGAEAVGEGISDGISWAASETARRLQRGIDFVVDAGGAIGKWVAARADDIVAAAELIYEGVTEVIEAISDAVQALVEALIAIGAALEEALFACPQPDALSAAQQPESDHFMIAVGGRDSSITRRGDGSEDPSFDLDWKRLGYRRSNVERFSYRDATTYRGTDTYGDLHAQARRLGEQIQARAAVDGSRPVDLIGHSQGGVVIALFLQEQYYGHEDEYPPISNVVTFASPLQGTPTANLGVSADQSALNAVTGDALDNFNLGTTALQQLCEGSSTIEGLWEHRLPAGVRFLSIAGLEDWVVPSPNTHVPDGTNIVVQAGDPFLPDDHSAIVHDDDAISAAQAHLRGDEPAGCGVLVGAPGIKYADTVRHVNTLVALTDSQVELDLPAEPEPIGGAG
jgi:hypothetical protein